MNKSNSIKSQSLIVGGIVFLILLLDQLLKIYVKNNFQPGVEHPILGDWFVMDYIENKGMAFGTAFGNKPWHKLALSLFRVVAVIFLIYYWFKYARAGKKLNFLIPFGLVIAGALGNLLDSMYFDYYFPYDPCYPFNLQEGSGIKVDCGFWGEQETKLRGFLFGNVVDMFKFDATWPQWMPWLGGQPVFPAIWNLADAAITTGLLIILFWNRKFFPKDQKNKSAQVTDSEQDNQSIH